MKTPPWRRGWFIEVGQFGIPNDRDRVAQALALPARELANELVAVGREVGEVERLIDLQRRGVVMPNERHDFPCGQ